MTRPALRLTPLADRWIALALVALTALAGSAAALFQRGLVASHAAVHSSPGIPGDSGATSQSAEQACQNGA